MKNEETKILKRDVRRECKKCGGSQVLKDLPYHQYLSTSYWRTLSKYVKQEAHSKCQLCGSYTINALLNVHHNTYRHKGEEIEHMEDLVCLCEYCHNLYHKNANEIKNQHTFPQPCSLNLEEDNEEFNPYKNEIKKLNKTIEEQEQRINKLVQKYEEAKEEIDYADWKLRLYYEQTKHVKKKNLQPNGFRLIDKLTDDIIEDGQIQ